MSRFADSQAVKLQKSPERAFHSGAAFSFAGPAESTCIRMQAAAGYAIESADAAFAGGGIEFAVGDGGFLTPASRDEK